VSEEQPSGRSPARTRRGLGRGLDALIPVTEKGAVREVASDRIEPNPNQPRQRFERKALEDLAASIREHGLVQPLVVTDAGDDRYRLIVGERRWRAAVIAGLPRVPVVVREVSDRDTLELALVENVQRADLNPLEEAAAYQRLIQDFGLTHQQVGERVGKSRVAISNTIRLLGLPETLKRAVVEERISEGHARAVLMLPDRDLQVALLERIERDGLTVRQAEELARRLLERAPRRSKPARDANLTALEGELQRALGTRVTLRQGRRGGRIVIEYFSDDEFEGLYRRLVGEG